MSQLDYLLDIGEEERLNTLTKYPSIMTYHELNRGGVRGVEIIKFVVLIL